MLTGSNTNTVGNTFHHVIGIVLDKRNYIYKHGTFLTAALMKQTLEGPKTQLDALLLVVIKKKNKQIYSNP